MQKHRRTHGQVNDNKHADHTEVSMLSAPLQALARSSHPLYTQHTTPCSRPVYLHNYMDTAALLVVPYNAGW